jgi:hypothetical protein
MRRMIAGAGVGEGKSTLLAPGSAAPTFAAELAQGAANIVGLLCYPGYPGPWISRPNDRTNSLIAVDRNEADTL